MKDDRTTKINGDVLLYNDMNPKNRRIYEAAKAETNAAVIIAKPGGRQRMTPGVGIWVSAKNRYTDMSDFWAAVDRLRKQTK